MAAFTDLEVKLNDIFGKKAPELPKNAKEFIVKLAPILALILGILTLLSVLALWRWAHVIHTYSNFAGGDTVGESRLTVWIWFTLIILAIEAVLYIAAFSTLQARKKQGWNYIYWAALVNLLYALAVLFTDYAGIGSFIWDLILAAVGFWILFQIRPYYTGQKVVTEPIERPRRRPSKPEAPKPPKE